MADEKYVQGEIGGTISSPLYIVDDDYSKLENKPTINGIELDGNKTVDDFGSFEIQTFEGKQSDISVTGTPIGSVDITPKTGTVSQISRVGSLPSLRSVVENETLSFVWDPGTVATKEDVLIMTGIENSSFNGKSFVSKGKYTPNGTISKVTFTNKDGE